MRGKSLAGIAVVFAAYVIGKSIGHVAGKDAADSLSSSAWSESVWTAERKAELVESMRAKAAAFPFITNEQDRSDFAACAIEKVVARTPGGPKQVMAGMTTEARNKLFEQAGFECGVALRERILGSPTWIPTFGPLYEAICVKQFGKEDARKFCRCVAENAPSEFAGPALFVKTDSDVAANNASVADTARFNRVLQPCMSLLPQ